MSLLWVPLTLSLIMLQEVQVRSHATTSCTQQAMLMAQSALRSEQQASGRQPVHQYKPLCKITSRLPDITLCKLATPSVSHAIKLLLW